MTPDSPDPLGWLPQELEPVALRLARADECVFMIGDLVHARAQVAEDTFRQGRHRRYATAGGYSRDRTQL